MHGPDPETRSAPPDLPTFTYAMPSTIDAPRPVPSGTIIAGRYKLLEEIGEGGMGTVYLAEQTEPVRRMVALKLIKPGMDSKQVLARFEVERQALALMDHPHIAKVLDGGATVDGRPFFVMEYVKGVSITKYCDNHKLATRQRLALFVDACQAIQHAHQKGIIHRDLKPSNVLVTETDGRPVPKVIDFGLAKATVARLTERSLYTGFGAVIGTPEYMAPEQADPDQFDIDTRADVYSLGVILYELLTGSAPFDRRRLGSDAGLLEILRVLREEEPARPSTRLSAMTDLQAVAANRGTDPRRLAAIVRGELDWITLKCLEKDRNRRYQTASALAADVQRYLADESVEACPPSTGYRLKKLYRRHRAAVLATGAVMTAIILAVIGQTWNLMRARDAEASAKQSEENAIAEGKAAARDRDRATKAEAEQAKARELAERERDAKQAALTRSDGLRLASEATLARPSNPGLALLLGLEGVRRYPHHLTFTSLFDAAGELREKRVIWTNYFDARFLRLSHDAARILVGSEHFPGPEQGLAAIYDSVSGKKLVGWQGLLQGLGTLDWSSDGQRVVATSNGQATVVFTDGQQPEQATYTDRVAYVWDATTGRDLVHLRRHDDKIVSARFSPDGTKIVTASWDGTARIWDAKTGKQLHVLRGHKMSLLLALFTPDGKRVLTISAQTIRSSHNKQRLDSESPERYPNADPGPTTRPNRSQGWSSSSNINYTGQPEVPFARIWSAETGQPAGSLELEKSSKLLYDFNLGVPVAKAIAFSPDGRQLAVGFENDPIGIWDLAAGGKPARTFVKQPGQTFCLAFNPSGTRLVSAGSQTSVSIWNLETKDLPLRLDGHDHSLVTEVKFSADGSKVLSASADRTARVWEVATGRPLATLRGHTNAIHAAHFLADGNTILTGGDSTIRFWSLAPPPPVPTLLADEDPGLFGQIFRRPGLRHHTASVTALAFNPHGTMVLTGSQDMTVRLWHAETGRHAEIIADSNVIRGTINSFAFAPDGRTIYLATDANRINSAETGDKETMLSMVHRWDQTTGRCVRFLKNQNSGVTHMSLNLDGTRILLVSATNSLAYRPTKSRPQWHTFDQSQPSGRVTIWDTTTGQLVATLPPSRDTYGIAKPRFSPDGKQVLHAPAEGNTLSLFDTQSGAIIRALTPPKDNWSSDWTASAFSPDGQVAVGIKSGARDVWFWETATGALLGSYRIPDVGPSWQPVISFVPDSKRLAVATDRAISIVDVTTRAVIHTLRGHEAKVNAMAISPDGSRLLSGSDDQSAAIWDLTTGGLLTVYKGHPGPVQRVAYSPDGKRVATASTDNFARVWPVDLVPVFERRKPRELTVPELDRYELPRK